MLQSAHVTLMVVDAKSVRRGCALNCVQSTEFALRSHGDRAGVPVLVLSSCKQQQDVGLESPRRDVSFEHLFHSLEPSASNSSMTHIQHRHTTCMHTGVALWLRMRSWLAGCHAPSHGLTVFSWWPTRLRARVHERVRAADWWMKTCNVCSAFCLQRAACCGGCRAVLLYLRFAQRACPRGVL